jgi:hypothetical protein
MASYSLLSLDDNITVLLMTHLFVNGNSENLWVWNLFYVADFIIMGGALVWYNRFHISHDLSRRKKKIINS